MKLATFFEKFDQFADAPGAVAKMREFVLAMAVQGRLSDRRSSDSPVEALVQRLRESKISDSRARDLKVEEVASARLPFQVPLHWARIRLYDIGAISGGHTPSKNNHRFWNGDIPWFTSKDIKSDEIYESELKITEAAADSPGLQLYPPGCLFMVARSGILKRTFPVAINRVAAMANQDLKILRPFVPGLERYLQIMLQGLTPFILSELVKTGMTVQSLKYDEFAAQHFPLPPLAEQKRIVAKVDELMALCDRLEAQQQAREEQSSQLARASLVRFATAPTPANLNYLFHPSYNISPADLRKSILTLAVQGKLVPQDPNDEPAEELLKRISIIREHLAPRKRAHAVKRVRELEGSNCTQDVPSSWTWCRLGELVLEFRYGTSRKCSHVENGIPVLRIPNIRNGRIDPADLKFTNMPPSEFNELQLREGDLLLVRSNGSETLVGRSAVVTSIDERFAYAGYLVRARLPKSDIFAPFIHVALSTQGVRNQIEGPIRTTSGVKNINTTELSNLTLPLPPVAEQRRIVARVSQLMTLVDELETHLTTTRTTAQNLLTALIAELSAPK